MFYLWWTHGVGGQIARYQFMMAKPSELVITAASQHHLLIGIDAQVRKNYFDSNMIIIQKENGTLARSDAHLPGMRMVMGLILTSSKILLLRLVMKYISTAILSLPLIQEGQLSFTGKRMFTKYVLVNCLGGLPRNSVNRLTDRARIDLKSVEGP